MFEARAISRCWHLASTAMLAATAAGQPQSGNLALDRPVDVSSYEADSYPEYAVDGDATLTHWWGANPYPQWLEVDLQSVAQLDQLHLTTYWDGSRHYQYTVAVSLDGASWSQVVDMSANTAPSTAAGFLHDLGGVQARFVRADMLFNSANVGVHIVELEALGNALVPGEIDLVPGGPIAFGEQDVNTGASAAVRIELRNVDPTGYLSLHAVELGGAHPGDFDIVSDTGQATLGPGEVRALELAFDPAVPGARSAELTIRSDDADEGELEVPLTGTGTGRLHPLIPQPTVIRDLGGDLALTAASRVLIAEPDIAAHAEVLAGELYRLTGLHLAVGSGAPQPGDIVLSYESPYGAARDAERYRLDASSTVDVRGANREGLARGTAALLQLVGAGGTLPRVVLRDAPTFSYRALSLDVARKFHSIDVLKQAVDLCRFYKVRALGLHLTDDQNFMFPSAAFPDADQNNFDRPAYALADLRELERYAAARGVAVVPELDVPGHSAKLVQLYPQVFGSLSGNTIDFRLPSCVEGVKTLVSEMQDVFTTAPYFHIGGDESGFTHLPEFVPFVEALDRHVKARGQRTLMWEGFGPTTAVPKDVLVVNWESSYYPPDAMLAAGYTVVNGGWDPLYVVDHYPWVQYTYHCPERLYGFDPYTFRHVASGYPTSNGITVPPGSDVAGAELCWWEGRGDYAIPILRNRVPAFGARLWNPGGEQGLDGFEARFQVADQRLEALLFPVRVRALGAIHDYWKPEQPFAGQVTVQMQCPLAGEIRYTLDGTEPTAQSAVYTAPLSLGATTTVKAALFDAGRRVGYTTRVGLLEVQVVPDLTTGRPVAADSPPFLEHPVELVVDGVVEADSYWTAFPNPAAITIDLEAPRELDGVTVFSHWGGGYYERYRVQLSLDGLGWSEVVDSSANTQPATAAGYAHAFPPVLARYLRVVTTGNSWFPDGRFPRIVEVRASEAP